MRNGREEIETGNKMFRETIRPNMHCTLHAVWGIGTSWWSATVFGVWPWLHALVFALTLAMVLYAAITNNNMVVWLASLVRTCFLTSDKHSNARRRRRSGGGAATTAATRAGPKSNVPRTKTMVMKSGSTW